MKRLLLLILLCGPCCAATITGSIGYNFAGTVPCTATLTTNCVVSFSVGYMNGAAFVPVGPVALPATPSGPMTITIPAIAFNGVYGATIQLAATVIYHDWQGNTATSPTFFLAAGTISALPPSLTGFTPNVTNP